MPSAVFWHICGIFVLFFILWGLTKWSLLFLCYFLRINQTEACIINLLLEKNLLNCLYITITNYPMVFKLLCEHGPSYLFNWLVELWLILSALWSLKCVLSSEPLGLLFHLSCMPCCDSLRHLNTHLSSVLQYCFSDEGFPGSSHLRLKFLSVLCSPNTFTATLDWFFCWCG